MAASGIASWINYDETGKAIFFRAKDGSGYNLDKLTQTWMRAGYVNGITTEHILEFASVYQSKE